MYVNFLNFLLNRCNFLNLLVRKAYTFCLYWCNTRIVTSSGVCGLTTKQLELNWTKFSSAEPVEKEGLEAK